MKEIRAYIKRHKLSEVTRALHKVPGLTGLTIVETRGVGVGWKKGGGTDGLVSYQPGLKLEILCCDALVEEVVALIERAAHTGLKGDGKIYVSTIDMAVRISTGERGGGAV
ncbi:transcriptional regulator [Geothermobacter hydrogeniphilus]|uniref:Transcriptional regulator n=1 Tax=Geothermobacter hydrogeniphilus TaxID=1969733 RepID=A0A2K2HAY0_9BACT|nr:P-II family nitrogen regulator [Geothermobacter hydrogeniphilus]PNU20466.1 transcriptional regulator [Geothermobacter hydrogeniphilus]